MCCAFRSSFVSGSIVYRSRHDLDPQKGRTAKNVISNFSIVGFATVHCRENSNSSLTAGASLSPQHVPTFALGEDWIAALSLLGTISDSEATANLKIKQQQQNPLILLHTNRKYVLVKRVWSFRALCLKDETDA